MDHKARILAKCSYQCADIFAGHWQDAAARPGEINISLDSSSPEIYRNVKGINGFARVVDSLKKYVADARSPAQIVLKYIIYEKQPDTGNCAIHQNVRISWHQKIQLSFDFREVNANKVSEQTLCCGGFSCPGRPGILALKRCLFISPGKLLKKSTILQWPIFHDFLLAIQKKDYL